MTQRQTLSVGLQHLSRMPGAEGDGTVQTAVAIDPETGETVVLLRLGTFVATLDPAGAARLGRALQVESALATVQALAKAPPE